MADHGYTHEKNTAFFPLFPLILRFITRAAEFLSLDRLVLIFAYQVTLGCFNCLMLYDLGLKTLSKSMAPERAERISFRAAQLYNLSQTMVYQISPYSEVTFTFLQLLSAEIIYSSDFDPHSGTLPCTSRIAIASIPLALATFSRSPGLISVILPLWFLGLKVSHNLASLKNKIISLSSLTTCARVLLDITVALVIVICVVAVPIFALTTKLPLKLYCLPKLGSDASLPASCQ